MTAVEAYTKARQHGVVKFGINDHEFAYVGWTNPEKRKSGPYLITIDSSVAIEVDRNGKFQDAFSSDANNYFPWVEKK